MVNDDQATAEGELGHPKLAIADKKQQRMQVPNADADGKNDGEENEAALQLESKEGTEGGGERGERKIKQQVWRKNRTSQDSDPSLWDMPAPRA